MKTPTVISKPNSLFNLLTTTLQLCQRKLKSLSLSQFLLLWEPQLLMHSKGLDHALRVIRGFLAACREVATNRRHVLAVGVMMVGCGASVFYHLFDNTAIDKEWYYLNWYYFFYTIREELMLGFWAVGTFLFLPTKYKLSFIPCLMLLTYSIATIFHYYFFVDSLETFHADIPLSIIIASGSLALGIIISTDYLTYRYHHLGRGNHARFVGVAEMKLTPEEKEKMYELLAKEYRNHNARI